MIPARIEALRALCEGLDGWDARRDAEVRGASAVARQRVVSLFVGTVASIVDIHAGTEAPRLTGAAARAACEELQRGAQEALQERWPAAYHVALTAALDKLREAACAAITALEGRG